MKSRIKAFTLIELLVVVTVILILSTLTILNLSSTRAKARDQQRISNAQLIGSAIDQIAMSGGRKYPTFNVQPSQVETGLSSKSYLVEPINTENPSSCPFCDKISPYLNPIPKDNLDTDASANMKYIYNADGTKAAVVIDKMETGTKLCNISGANINTLPEPVQAYMGIGGEIQLTGGANPNPCYYVAK